jgi:mediator of RNA polymerase II transcription subunit 14
MGAGRVLVGGRAWAGAVATLLPVGALEVLCTPCEPPTGAPGPLLAPLERFLGCVYMRRHLQRFIQQEDTVNTFYYQFH